MLNIPMPIVSFILEPRGLERVEETQALGAPDALEGDEAIRIECNLH